MFWSDIFCFIFDTCKFVSLVLLCVVFTFYFVPPGNLGTLFSCPYVLFLFPSLSYLNPLYVFRVFFSIFTRQLINLSKALRFTFSPRVHVSVFRFFLCISFYPSSLVDFFWRIQRHYSYTAPLMHPRTHTLTIKYSHFNGQKQVHIQSQHKSTCMCASMIDVTDSYCDHFYQLLLLGQILHSFPVLGSLNFHLWLFTFITGLSIVLGRVHGRW